MLRSYTTSNSVAAAMDDVYSSQTMKKALLTIVLLVLFSHVLIAQSTPTQPAKSDSSDARLPHEKHLRNVRQITFGGQNAEAYFSPDEKLMSFQSVRDGGKCDQIYTMNSDGSNTRLVSGGKGRTTCSYILPDSKHILYSSTQMAGPECPPPPDYSKGYTWALYPTYDIYKANLDGSDAQRMTTTDGYDAEATISADGKKIVFNSIRDGDLDIYTMDIDGKNVKRLTDELGYDGGPFFSEDGQWIVYRAYHPKTEKEISEYKDLLKQNLIRPTTLEIWVMKADGTEKHQVSKLNAASFAPFFMPEGASGKKARKGGPPQRIIFSSNSGSTGGMGNFELWAIDVDGTNLERITYNDTFDGFPMFTRDGKHIVFASNRRGKPHETNVFYADWVK